MVSGIEPIGRVQRAGAVRATDGAVATTPTHNAGFGDVLSGALDNLNQSAQTSDGLAEAFAAGEDVEIHEVMVAVQETQIAFQLATQVRNRAVEAYQEIMRMQL